MRDAAHVCKGCVGLEPVLAFAAPNRSHRGWSTPPSEREANECAPLHDLPNSRFYLPDADAARVARHGRRLEVLFHLGDVPDAGDKSLHHAIVPQYYCCW